MPGTAKLRKDAGHSSTGNGPGPAARAGLQPRDSMTFAWIPLIAAPLAAALSAGLILRLMPLLRRYALARPNARSSHVVPTPQGGGIAVVTALVTVSGLLAGAPEVGPREAWTWLAGCTLALAVLGAVDDLRPLPALPRLAVQILVVGLLVSHLDGRLVPEIPSGWNAPSRRSPACGS